MTPPPESRSRKPSPLARLTHFTVPCSRSAMSKTPLRCRPGAAQPKRAANCTARPRPVKKTGILATTQASSARIAQIRNAPACTGPLALMLNRLRRAYIPVLTQITVPYVILAMLIAAGGIYLLTQVVVDSVTERFINQLIEPAKLSEEGLVRVEQRMLESQRLLSHVQGIDAAIEDRLRSALSQLALPIAVNAELEAFVFLDDAGNSLLSLNLDEGTRTYEQLTPSDPYRSVGFIQQVLRGEGDEQGGKTSGCVSTALGG